MKAGINGEEMKGIFKDEASRFDKIPRDIQKLIIGKTILERNPGEALTIANKIILCDDPEELICNNIELWKSLWYKYISTKISVEDLTLIELKKKFKKAFAIYEIGIFIIHGKKSRLNISKIRKSIYPASMRLDQNEIEKIKKMKVKDVNNIINGNYDVIINNANNLRKIYALKNDYDQIKNISKDIVYFNQKFLWEHFLDYVAALADEKLFNIIKDNLNVSNLNHMLIYIIKRRMSYANNLIELLIKNGADANNLIPGYSLKNYVDILIEYGYDINKTNDKGDTLLFYVENPKYVQLLIDKGADINHQNNDGNTPIHEIIKKSYSINIDKLKILMKNNADTSITNNDDLTPLDLLELVSKNIIKSDLYEIIEILSSNTQKTDSKLRLRSTRKNKETKSPTKSPTKKSIVKSPTKFQSKITSDVTTEDKCHCITLSGNRCKNKAIEGSQYCYIKSHQNCDTT